MIGVAIGLAGVIAVRIVVVEMVAERKDGQVAGDRATGLLASSEHLGEQSAVPVARQCASRRIPLAWRIGPGVRHASGVRQQVREPRALGVGAGGDTIPLVVSGEVHARHRDVLGDRRLRHGRLGTSPGLGTGTPVHAGPSILVLHGGVARWRCAHPVTRKTLPMLSTDGDGRGT